jgi:hypothetical protein
VQRFEAALVRLSKGDREILARIVESVPEAERQKLESPTKDKTKPRSAFRGLRTLALLMPIEARPTYRINQSKP